MSIETYPLQTADPESYILEMTLQGTGGGTVPTVQPNKHGVSIARTGAGLYTLTFAEEPGPTFMGLDGAFSDSSNPATVLGWTATGGTYTKRSGGTKATLTMAIGNSSAAATDPASTSSCVVSMCFKLGPAKE